MEESKIIKIKLEPDLSKIPEVPKRPETQSHTDEKFVKNLKVVQFSVHPTMADIQYIASLTSPLHINPIGGLATFPFDLNYLCRFDDNIDKENYTVIGEKK